MIDLLPSQHRHLNFCDNMPASNSHSCIDLPPLSARISELEDSMMDEDSSLEIIKNDVTHLQHQIVEENVDIVQSNTLDTRFSSPIWRLPTDILAEIFKYCLPDDEHLAPASRLAPILLTTVCRRWREIAVGLPILWCRLQLGRKWQWNAVGYNSWLQRSNKCPLSLRIKYYGHWSKLRELLQPYMAQISILTLDFFPYMEPVMMEDLYALKELTVHKHSPRPIYCSLLKMPVSLRRLNIPNMFFDRQQLGSFTDSAWAHTTHLEINVKGLDAFPHILRMCPNLSFVTMHGLFHPIDVAEPITHHNLQSLRMSGDVSRNSGPDLGLFNILTLPNLRVVESYHMGPWPHEEFKEFLRRSNCPLEKLFFGIASFVTARQQAEYAMLFPSLEIIADPASNLDMVYRYVEHRRLVCNWRLVT
ncbi:hypothetical protein BDR07DRAFT_260359 [Suillus spraguei]|nr:hypothetical protein BDR07DRAFT_260359 [Suillus spraguei]